MNDFSSLNWDLDDEDVRSVTDELADRQKAQFEEEQARVNKMRSEQLGSGSGATANAQENADNNDQDDGEPSDDDDDGIHDDGPPEDSDETPADGVPGDVSGAEPPIGKEPEKLVPKPVSDRPRISNRMAPQDRQRAIEEFRKQKLSVRKALDEPRASKPKPKPAEPKPMFSLSSQKRERGDVVQIRDFPASIASHIQNMFPGKPAMGKAIAAYILATSDIDLSGAGDIPDDIRELSRSLKSKERQASVTDIYDRLANIDKDNDRTEQVLRELELAISYIIFDRAGFRQDNAASPGDINILESGVMDTVDRLRQQGKLSKNEDKYRHGRTIR